MITFVTYTNT
ncbi:hypothetical protein ACHAXM_000837 [Skeletonema potamos]